MRKLLTLALAVISMLFWTDNILGAEFFISANGSDENPGTFHEPFMTIQKAADLMVAGDTCTVMEGTYREWVSQLKVM